MSERMQLPNFGEFLRQSQEEPRRLSVAELLSSPREDRGNEEETPEKVHKEVAPKMEPTEEKAKEGSASNVEDIAREPVGEGGVQDLLASEPIMISSSDDDDDDNDNENDNDHDNNNSDDSGDGELSAPWSIRSDWEDDEEKIVNWQRATSFLRYGCPEEELPRIPIRRHPQRNVGMRYQVDGGVREDYEVRIRYYGGPVPRGWECANCQEIGQTCYRLAGPVEEEVAGRRVANAPCAYCAGHRVACNIPELFPWAVVVVRPPPRRIVESSPSASPLETAPLPPQIIPRRRQRSPSSLPRVVRARPSPMPTVRPRAREGEERGRPRQQQQQRQQRQQQQQQRQQEEQ